ncbi:hypothetical protein COW36_07295 [bacterium (Candidatus Blackallbacteria) CG17_big_fil_post_rev_8_21_14_2_50_48_46]|uniref:Uncharacterized protein n=1 Tax=bacterium (Candidatus Blackallbacteria) CG17_big_fil_post_rev_8_21_14_2_50_48_46 TaxID=2014261 RepID=A0A2M7G787_9BACT|nr:MAG: hypothetical protein COW64_06805 [bacterium (Candidatus Blackallbacteria) CG18_big_fil_WC_8_21_14_2_50_49_26]PIW17867.1 MAG: hypothetical protein COW36_07295 [bacterium (Candidatus Blackallbacteria) CG17_big_fil_post_rev_8_21_14_2_50_48_46]PIW48543.1 MAG: hypothetical protein COW20_09250 [bacterium (Candidatus Blackallbacteria) CG13_big_fil_rev_8_21_14_2_50_49_14]
MQRSAEPLAVLPQVPLERYVIDLGSSESRASFSVRIEPAQSFQIQASKSGYPANNWGQILSLRVFLVNAASLPAPGVLNPVGGNVYTVAGSFSSASKDISFHNVPPGSYYVAAAAYLTSTGPYNAGSNITQAGSYTYSEGNLALSNGGGLGGADAGRVVIDAQNQINGNAQLQIPLALRSETGAQIETQISLIDNP